MIRKANNHDSYESRTKTAEEVEISTNTADQIAGKPEVPGSEIRNWNAKPRRGGTVPAADRKRQAEDELTRLHAEIQRLKKENRLLKTAVMSMAPETKERAGTGKTARSPRKP